MAKVDPIGLISSIVVHEGRDSGLRRAEQWLVGSLRGQVPELDKLVAGLQEQERNALRLLVRECVDAAMFSLLSGMQAAAAREPPVRLLIGDLDVLDAIPEGAHGAYQEWIETLSSFGKAASVVAAERRALEFLAEDSAGSDDQDE